MAAAMYTATLFIFIWMLAAMPPDVSPFILEEMNCVAFPPCTCSGQTVNCGSKGLSTVPKFEVSNVTGSTIFIELNNNQLTSIPANAFRNLTVAYNTNVYMDLYSNDLNTIATHAFAGIANTMTYLHLDNNNFTSLPSELVMLSKLQTLYTQGNPISSLSPCTMRALGSHLTSFSLDLKHFRTWPSELKFLTSLTSLRVENLNTAMLDNDAFDGFENTLKDLYISNTKLARIPTAICHLSNLQFIAFTNNYQLHVNSTVIEPCDRPLTSVTRVNLRENNLEYMPDVFHSFPSMDFLKLISNKLSFILWDTIPYNHPLTYLTASNNDFTRIPTALGKLRNLTSLDLGSNKITSVEDTDLHYFTHLNSLSLSYNPLQYISPNAFQHNLALQNVYLDRTQLHQLPCSIAGLHNMVNLHLSRLFIECNCDLAFLKPLNVTRIYIDGNCHGSSLSIKTYLKENLPNCP